MNRVDAGMILKACGQASFLLARIESEQRCFPDFLRLANALSTLYPKFSEETRLLNAMLLAAPR